LNYLLLYLRKLEAESNDDWLTDDHQKLTGFTWRRGAGKTRKNHELSPNSTDQFQKI